MTITTPAPTTVPTDHRPAAHAHTLAAGGRIDAIGVSQHVGERQILHDVSLAIEPGELVALVGSSGAGKTTLLEVLAGLRPPSGGEVRHDGIVVDTDAPSGSGIGYVPQDDIIHRDMPLRRTLRYAARLRLPAGTPPDRADRVVDQTLLALGLADRGDVVVRGLSGGQRKRASIAVELLTEPRSFFLDEPTSGLDPSTAAEVVRLLRGLTRRGVTVVLTTHEPATIERCDRVVVLARDGHLAFAGTPDEARGYFGVDDLTDIYDQLAAGDPPRALGARFAAWRPPTAAPVPPATRPDGPRALGVVRQWRLLTRRNADVLVRNRLTLAVLLGSPALVTAMMAMLFRPGAFEPQGQGDLGSAQTVFWIAFAGFFFGLTYGLLQIVGEVAVFRRERFAGLSVGAYVGSKIAVLLPVLAGVALVLLGVLRALDRLPAAGGDVYASLFATIIIEALSALALGLLASAVVSDAAQAALALPMLCFPQVLFAGAIVPVDEMALPGRALSMGMANRHGFEALGRGLHLDGYAATVPGMGAYGDTFSGSPVQSWLVLAGFAALFVLATVGVLRRRSRPGRRGRI
jgi:ABC-type multidrug transport system ATPase subunit/ABC-type multidrug transport system permease subunit